MYKKIALGTIVLAPLLADLASVVTPPAHEPVDGEQAITAGAPPPVAVTPVMPPAGSQGQVIAAGPVDPLPTLNPTPLDPRPVLALGNAPQTVAPPVPPEGPTGGVPPQQLQINTPNAAPAPQPPAAPPPPPVS